ncbi:hypothetical protein MPDQ_000614 [Monascus purpureus]|uniref:GH16 domain-containing protein n=1 Tax=Monascus purpureus TaxID=5098 RepID=A0A507QPF8_MONPU|nr:hypothetical protein MPDQ_000614 [Monascus purpureus]BDD55119.1 hypothetical protein MAP00_000671 [Monascus purpureus]
MGHPAFFLVCLAVLSCITSFAKVNAGISNRNTKSDDEDEARQQDLCDCYVVSGPDGGYFQHYQFWDFRNFSIPRRTSEQDQTPFEGQDEDNADDIQDRGGYISDGENDDSDDSDGDSGEDDDDYTNKNSPKTILLSQTPFAKDWIVQVWRREKRPVPMVNSERNIFITTDPQHPRNTNSTSTSTYLILRVTRFDNYSSTAEMESALRNIYHCSLRVRMRIISSGSLPSSSTQVTEEDKPCLDINKNYPPGACAGIFTYNPASKATNTDESDIEILTSDPPHRIHYANQPDYNPITDRPIPGASSVIDLPTPWTSWAVHRLDWFPGFSAWYSDGRLQDMKTYCVPSKPSLVVLNLWSDGGNWTGDLRKGESVLMGVEWIEMAYNLSTRKTSVDIPRVDRRSDDLDGADARGQGGCRNVCRVEDISH